MSAESIDPEDIPSTPPRVPRARSLHGRVDVSPTSAGLESIEPTTPNQSSAVRDGAGESDLITLLNVTQSNRLNDQRSATSPHVNMLLSPARTGNGASDSVPGSSQRDKLLRTRGRRQPQTADLVALEHACVVFDHVQDRGVLAPDLIFPSDDGTDLIKATDGWCLETKAPNEERAARSFPLARLPEGLQTADPGATYYRQFFHGQDHLTFVGESDHHGHILISVRREAVPVLGASPTTRPEPMTSLMHYRAIVRTSKRGITRLLIPESEILPGPVDDQLEERPVPGVKEVLGRLLDDMTVALTLKLAKVTPELGSKVLTMDEANINSEQKYKVGVVYCGSGQSQEQEMYNNEHGSAAFIRFLDAMASRIALKDFPSFSGGLDTSTDQTGTHAYFSVLLACQIVFHVSTELPYSTKEEQQVLRKRHIGNDIVTVVFQEEDAAPFDPASFKSHYQHVFIVIRAEGVDTLNLRYKVATVRRADVCEFLPDLPPAASFSSDDIQNGTFKAFLLKKIVNAERASYVSGHLLKLGARTRIALLQDAVETYGSDLAVSSLVKRGSLIKLMTLGRRKPSDAYSQLSRDGPSWWIKTADTLCEPCNVWLALAADMVVIVDEETQAALHLIPFTAIIGWFLLKTGLRLWYNRSEAWTDLLCSFEVALEIERELARAVPDVGPIIGMQLQRADEDVSWGFDVEGVDVLQVETGSPAGLAGLSTAQKLFRINGFCPLDLSSERLITVANLHTTDMHLLVKCPPSTPPTYTTLTFTPSSRGSHASNSPEPAALRQLDHTPRARRAVRSTVGNTLRRGPEFDFASGNNDTTLQPSDAVQPADVTLLPQTPGANGDMLLQAIAAASSHMAGSGENPQVTHPRPLLLPVSGSDPNLGTQLADRAVQQQRRLQELEASVVALTRRLNAALAEKDVVVSENVQLRHMLALPPSPYAVTSRPGEEYFETPSTSSLSAISRGVNFDHTSSTNV